MTQGRRSPLMICSIQPAILKAGSARSRSKLYTNSASNPDMPSEGIYGIKFDAVQDQDLETYS